ncbi:MAG TPA: hypothetical protein VGO48_15720 [Conexibacter sp.]|jgi:hypothetical protein|nr:hypothetical protein [Conexibacter sp.]
MNVLSQRQALGVAIASVLLAVILSVLVLVADISVSWLFAVPFAGALTTTVWIIRFRGRSEQTATASAEGLRHWRRWGETMALAVEVAQARAHAAEVQDELAEQQRLSIAHHLVELRAESAHLQGELTQREMRQGRGRWRERRALRVERRRRREQLRQLEHRIADYERRLREVELRLTGRTWTTPGPASMFEAPTAEEAAIREPEDE